MSDFLSEIIKTKQIEVETRKQQLSFEALKAAIDFNLPTRSLKQNVSQSNSSQIFVISEFKRSSPSRGAINQAADLSQVVQAYQQGGAAALSVLTEEKRFSGSLADLALARTKSSLPILRKDFVIDAYQILEAKLHGADLILLIAEALSGNELKQLIDFAHQCKIEVLLEFHEQTELEKILQLEPDFLGVNCRNLRTLQVDWQHLLRMAPLLPETAIKVAESGINSLEQVQQLSAVGYRGFLIGEYLMQSANPELALRNLLTTVEGQK